jgi:hypothetical protein
VGEDMLEWSSKLTYFLDKLGMWIRKTRQFGMVKKAN